MIPDEADLLARAFSRDGAQSVIASMLGDRAATQDKAEDRVDGVMWTLEEMAEHRRDAACCLMLSLWPVAADLMMHDVCDAIDLWIAHNRSVAVVEYVRRISASETDPDLKRHYKALLTMTNIRPATLNDSNALFSLAKAFATSFEVERSSFESSLAALLQSPDAFIAIACDGERVVGYVLGFDHHTFYANGRVAWVEEIMVSEECRRCGVGRQLMQGFEQWARSRESKLISLATRRAAPFYRSLGYEESATYFRRLL